MAKTGERPLVEIQDTRSADIPADGLVDDAIAWRSELVYSNGVRMSYSSEGNPHPDGIRFVGTEGWIHITGGGTLSASPADVLKSVIGPDEVHLYTSPGHHRNFLDCIKTRALTRANAEAACWAHITCHAANIALYLDRKVKYDPKKNEFIDDAQANRLRSEALREPWRI